MNVYCRHNAGSPYFSMKYIEVEVNYMWDLLADAGPAAGGGVFSEVL